MHETRQGREGGGAIVIGVWTGTGTGTGNCDDICMCVVNKRFELLEFVFDSVYVNLQYDEIYLTFTAGSLCLGDFCSHVIAFGLSVRLSWYTMWMRWLLWLCCVYCCLYFMCVCWESMKMRWWRQPWCGCQWRCGCCEWGGGGEYMGGTRGSGFVSIADDVLEMNVVYWVRWVGEGREMCMCLARGEWVVGGGGLV